MLANHHLAAVPGLLLALVQGRDPSFRGDILPTF
jgi:hypothetical protein